MGYPISNMRSRFAAKIFPPPRLAQYQSMTSSTLSDFDRQSYFQPPRGPFLLICKRESISSEEIGLVHHTIHGGRVWKSDSVGLYTASFLLCSEGHIDVVLLLLSSSTRRIDKVGLRSLSGDAVIETHAQARPPILSYLRPHLRPFHL